MAARRLISHRLPGSLVDGLSAESRRLGVTRTELVERILTAGLTAGAQADPRAPSLKATIEAGRARSSAAAKSGVRAIPKGGRTERGRDG